MSQKLVIVESPAKARTLQKYLGKEFRVLASMGHVRDLPKSELAIDLEHDFEPVYEITKQKVVAELRQALKGAEALYLATDPDREGEAIAWHITQALKVAQTMPVYRVVFHEITKQAVQSAIEQPRQIDPHLVDAQQARRVLDRLVGYQLSPLLWEKVRRGLSAGRVQSVAVRLVVEREREIEAFKPVEYWTIEADLRKHQSQIPSDTFRATLIEYQGKKLDKFAIEREEQAREMVAHLEHAHYVVQKVTNRDTRRHPAPPFTTSTLQQEAGRKLGFSAKKTMMLAQRLYEGVDIGEEGSVGLITYMRTDSLNVAKEAQDEAREVILQRYGESYLPEQPPLYKTRSKGAQEAHEAIRPTSSMRSPESLAAVLEHDLLRLYDLIWKRFLASQMAPAIFDRTTVDIAARPRIASDAAYTFRATGSVLTFSGFLEVYREGVDEGEEDEDKEKRLPLLVAGEVLDLLALLPIQHFTEPPPRFTEASLVKEMERLGIGRPSTYAPILSTIQERQYVELREKKLFPTVLGRIVTDLLMQHFAHIMDYDFTSDLEQQLDDVAAGEKPWVPLVREFYEPFARTLEQARQEMRNVKQEELPTNVVCPRCKQGTLVIKFGRNGEFLACSRYQRKDGRKTTESTIDARDGYVCDFTSDFHYDETGNIILDQHSAPELSDVQCTECGRPMVRKKGRFGEFLGCSGYPECKAIRRLDKEGNPAPLPEPTGVTCPKCQRSELLKRRGRFGRQFYACARYPDCDYTTNDLALVSEYVPEPAQSPSPATDSIQTDHTTATPERSGRTRRTTRTR